MADSAPSPALVRGGSRGVGHAVRGVGRSVLFADALTAAQQRLSLSKLLHGRLGVRARDRLFRYGCWHAVPRGAHAQ
jgi:hypothetical protein